jgi:Tfp pilus assembly protein PilF
MRTALATEPGHLAATANLGAFLRITGEMEAASRLLRASMAQHPHQAGTRLNIVADLLQDGRSEAALVLLDEGPIPTDPQTFAHWRSQRALALIQLGRTDEARAVLDALGEGPADLAPLLLWRRILLASIAGDRATARQLAERQDALLAQDGPLVPEHRRGTDAGRRRRQCHDIERQVHQ